VEFVRSHFLVREGVRFNRKGNSNLILQIDLIEKTTNRWKEADVLDRLQHRTLVDARQDIERVRDA
jgi:hypothetical protein